MAPYTEHLFFASCGEIPPGASRRLVRRKEACAELRGLRSLARRDQNPANRMEQRGCAAVSSSCRASVPSTRAPHAARRAWKFAAGTTRHSHPAGTSALRTFRQKIREVEIFAPPSTGMCSPKPPGNIAGAYNPQRADTAVRCPATGLRPEFCIDCVY